MSGSKSRNKGYQGEYKARKLLKKMGYRVIWHNEDPNKADLTMKKNGLSFDTEIKYRASVPKTIYKYLNQDKDSNMVMMKRVSQKDRNKKWLVAMSLDTLDKIVKKGS